MGVIYRHHHFLQKLVAVLRSKMPANASESLSALLFMVVAQVFFGNPLSFPVWVVRSPLPALLAYVLESSPPSNLARCDNRDRLRSCPIHTVCVTLFPAAVRPLTRRINIYMTISLSCASRSPFSAIRRLISEVAVRQRAKPSMKSRRDSAASEIEVALCLRFIGLDQF